MTTGSMPESLRRTIADDLQPVRPLPPVWMRMLVAIATAAAGLGFIVVVFKMTLRPDMDQLPMWLGWGCTAVQLVVGIVLIGMALREAVPGNGVPTGAVQLAVGTGVLMQVLVGIATWMHTPGVPYVTGQGLATGVGCATHVLVPSGVITLSGTGGASR